MPEYGSINVPYGDGYISLVCVEKQTSTATRTSRGLLMVYFEAERGL